MYNDSITDNLLTPKDLASMLKVSQASVYRLIEGRKIPFFKVGGSLRFAKDDVNRFLKDVRVESR